MKRLCFLLISLSSSAFALLPPLAQSAKEIQTLVADPQLYDLLGSAEMIKDIIRTQDGFLVMTQNYALRVDIQYQPRTDNKAGPAQFTLNFHSPVDLK